MYQTNMTSDQLKFKIHSLLPENTAKEIGDVNVAITRTTPADC